MAIRVYISGPLQAADDLVAARCFYEQLAEICRSAGLTPYLPHQRTDPELHIDTAPVSVFRHDRKAIADCDLLIADIGRPSSGVGAELGLALSSHQPIIAVHRQIEQPSRFVLGMLEDYDAAAIISFDNNEGLADALLAELVCFTNKGGERRSVSVAPHKTANTGSHSSSKQTVVSTGSAFGFSRSK